MKKSFTKIVPDFWQERSQFFLISEISQKSSQSSYFEGCSDFYANTYIQVKEEINNSHIYKIIIEYLFEKTRIYTFNKNIIRSFQQYNTGQKIFVMNKIKINKCLKKKTEAKTWKWRCHMISFFCACACSFFSKFGRATSVPPTTGKQPSLSDQQWQAIIFRRHYNCLIHPILVRCQGKQMIYLGLKLDVSWSDWTLP